MKYGILARFIKRSFTKPVFDYLETKLPDLEMRSFKDKVFREYRAMILRSPDIGSFKDNNFVMALYAACFFLAIYKTERARMTDEIVEGLVQEASYCKAMRRAKEGKSAFSRREIVTRTRQAKWSREHIKEYPENWYYYFEKVDGKDEYYITHKECGVCKLAKREGCEEVTKLLCKMDFYVFELQGAVLDRTKTLGYGDDECNFHVMSQERAKELGFVKSSDSR